MGSLSRPSKILERVSPRPAGTPSPTITAPPGLLFSIINRSPGGRQKCRFRTRRPSKSAGSGAGSGGFRRDAFLENLCFVKGCLKIWSSLRSSKDLCKCIIVQQNQAYFVNFVKS